MIFLVFDKTFSYSYFSSIFSQAIFLDVCFVCRIQVQFHLFSVLTPIYSTRLMLLINFDQKINYNILVAFFSLHFFGYSRIFIALRHTHSRFTHFIRCHRPYKNHINFVRLFYRFRWFSHSGLKIVIFKWVCQPTCKISEWYIIRAILFFLSISSKYILIGFLKTRCRNWWIESIQMEIEG